MGYGIGCRVILTGILNPNQDLKLIQILVQAAARELESLLRKASDDLTSISHAIVCPRQLLPELDFLGYLSSFCVWRTEGI